MQPKLVNLSVEPLPKSSIHFDQFWRILDRLMASSQTSLQQIRFHSHDQFILDTFLLCVKNHALEYLSNLGIIVQEERADHIIGIKLTLADNYAGIKIMLLPGRILQRVHILMLQA